MYTYEITERKFYGRFGVSQTHHRITGNRDFNGPFYQRLAQTLRRMVSEHRHHFSTPDDNILHLGINTEGGSFFYNRVNEQRITVGQAISGDGIDRILDYFSQHIQSNKNTFIGAGTTVKIYSFPTQNFIPFDPPHAQDIA